MLFALKEGHAPSAHPLRSWAALALLFGFLAFLLAPRLKRDARPLTWDPAVHMGAAWKYDKDLAAGRLAGLLHPPRTPGHPPYPPFAHLVMVPLIRMAGPLGLDMEDAAALANLLFLAALGWAAFLLASDWWDDTAGVCAAVLATLVQPMQFYAADIQADIALSSCVALAYAFWVRSQHFFLRRWCLLLGLAAAAGLLTKWTFSLYTLPIAADALWRAWRHKRDVILRHVAYTFLIAALLAAPWYAVNLIATVTKVSRAAGLGGQEGDPTHGLDAWFFYTKALADGIGWPGLLAAFAGFAWLAVWRPQSGWVLAAWFGSSYAVWSGVSNKDVRYILPALAALPLAVSSLPLKVPVLAAAFLIGMNGWRALHPLPPRNAWPLADLLRKADALRSPGDSPAVLTLIANHERLNGTGLSWTAVREGLDGRLIVRSRSKGLGEFSEFVAVKTGDLGPARSVAGLEAVRAEALNEGGWFQNHFDKAASWGVPGGEILLFHRRPAPAGGTVPKDPAAALSRLVPGLPSDGLKASCDGGGCHAEADVLAVNGLTLRDVRLTLKGLRVAADDRGEPRVLELERMEVERLRLTGEDAARFLAGRVKPLKKAVVRFLPSGAVEVGGRLWLVPVSARFRPAYAPDEDVASVDVLSARVFGVPLPVGGIVKASLKPGRGWPFLVKLRGLRVAEGSLEVGP